MLTAGVPADGVDFTDTDPDDLRAMAGGLTATAWAVDEFSGMTPMLFPSNSVNQTSPSPSSTVSLRGDELLVGMLNSVSCRVVGSNRAILLF